jgi:hypothetical protein
LFVSANLAEPAKDDSFIRQALSDLQPMQVITSRRVNHYCRLFRPMPLILRYFLQRFVVGSVTNSNARQAVLPGGRCFGTG